MTAPVLIGRPGERGEALASALAADGAWVEPLEVMALETLEEDAALRSVWLDLDRFHKIVVTSPFAALQLIEAVDRYWPQLPVGIDFYAPGAGTATALEGALDVRVERPPVSAGEDTSEALLTLDSLSGLAHQRVLIVAGEGGRTLLAETLTARGAAVTRVATYRRVYRAPGPELQRRLAEGRFHALIVTSGELLEYLSNWCHQAALKQPLIVSSRRLAALAGTLGFCDLKVASGASTAALAAALNALSSPGDADVD
ncbi:uroporphyrinogen-III synthase [Halomonas sp. PAMB 3232]|uniref:uroporphyrinogen-III synthase n=1 Tax=Halomonas sp. PAMB 3232 TaxID=3075221 RepID=UPI0028A0962F|nr:uroporphyrinogen-III synthase [Halomonas sp. PAMB 3232]WNL40660.1 uroporphyrinogen-III synthase [Halomonas sp. PAMB 3232]